MSDGLDIFGLRAHDERHSETERLLRRLVEQVGQLSIDLGVTRTELRRTTLDLEELRESTEGLRESTEALRESTVSSADVDPALIEFNEKVKAARARLDDAREAAAEDWETSQDELFAAIEQLNAALA